MDGEERTPGDDFSSGVSSGGEECDEAAGPAAVDNETILGCAADGLLIVSSVMFAHYTRKSNEGKKDDEAAAEQQGCGWRHFVLQSAAVVVMIALRCDRKRVPRRRRDSIIIDDFQREGAAGYEIAHHRGRDGVIRVWIRISPAAVVRRRRRRCLLFRATALLHI